MKRAYRIALLCWAVPLASGVAIFLLWLKTGWVELMFVGELNIVFGVFGTLGGIAALGYYFIHGYCGEIISREQLWRRTLGGVALLLSNYAVAYGLMLVVAGQVAGALSHDPTI